MKAFIARAFGVLGVTMVVAPAFSQRANWDDECIDPANTAPRSTDYAIQGIGNTLMYCTMGLSGTVAYGDSDSNGAPCYSQVINLPTVGRFSYGIGSLGSLQRSSSNFNDNTMALTIGAPDTPAGTYCYVTTTKDGARTLFGANGIGEAFVGFSNRYMRGTTVNDGVRATCNVEVVADVVRMRWTLTNTDTETRNLGLWWGAQIGMLTAGGATSNSESGNADQSGVGLGGNSGRNAKRGYVYIPTGRPPRTDTSYDRSLDPNSFPSYVDFVFGQTDYFGMRIENLPSPATADQDPNNQPTEASGFVLGKGNFILGTPDTTTPTFNPTALLPDTLFTSNVAFIQQFPEQAVAPGQSRQILYYVRSTWGEGNYLLPYGVVVDAPKVIATGATDFDGNPSDGGIFPNPFNVRVYVDNVGGYGFNNEEFDLSSVKIRLDIDSKYDVAVQGNKEKVIATVPARSSRFTDFTVKAGVNANGTVPYTVTIQSQPGNVVKTIKGNIVIAARPRITLNDDVNFVTTPYIFGDSSWNAILENFLDPTVPGGEAQVFAYDPQQQGYVASLGAERGRAFWILYKKTNAGPITADLMGQPTTPNTFLTGSDNVQLRSGWNQIGNPYNYSFPISQILGVSASNPSQSHPWNELVSLGYVSNFVASYDPVTGDYSYVDGTEGLMEPGKGYWINVLDPNDLSMAYPPLYSGWVPNQSRTAGTLSSALKTAWTQSANHWRLKIAARNEKDIDAENYIGIAPNTKDANALRVFEPPIAPMKDLGLSVEELVNGKSTRVAQSLQPKGGRKEWRVMVDVKKAGQVTVTWPNLATVPSNVRFHLTDVASGTTRDLRRTSGYTFTADKAGTRELKITAEEGSAARAVIGNVVVSQPGRSTDKGAPITVSYTLSNDATTSVRILAANGREVYVASRGRADSAGENTITWTLRDKANRAVAPGAYRVEIVAETSGGERVRKTIAVNVIR